ncbi:MAG: GntP family permease [Fuerstiella sp.]
MSSFAIVGIGIAVVLVLIIQFRVNAFLALIAAAVTVSFLADGAMASKMPRVASEFGIAAGKVGLVIGFAAVIGEAMMRSGAADRIVQAFLAVLGVKRAPWALMGSGFVLSVPVFFDTVFYLLVPLARSLYSRTKENFLLYVLAICAGGAITHTLVPPTPGPLIMASTLGVSVGLMIVVGGLVALPSAVVGIMFAKYLNKVVHVESLGADTSSAEFATGSTADATQAPENAEAAFGSDIPLWEALLPVLLPVLMISGSTVVDTMRVKGENVTIQWVEDQTVHVSYKDKHLQQFELDRGLFADKVAVGDSAELAIVFMKNESAEKTGIESAEPLQKNSFNDFKQYTDVFGNAALALGLSMILSIVTWVRFRKPAGDDFSQGLETALLSGGLVILITAAGGAFGAMLKLTGIGDDIEKLFADSNAVGLVSLLLAFGMASLLKVAQGSSTTAMITVSAMMAAFGLTEAELGFNLVYICTAIGAGSLVGSWMNDSGFWIVAKMSGLTETEALKTWTPLLAVLGCTSLLMTILLTRLLPLVG